MTDENITSATPGVPTTSGQDVSISEQEHGASTDTGGDGDKLINDGVASTAPDSQQEANGSTSQTDQVESDQEGAHLPALPENLHYDDLNRIFDDQGVEYDANFDIKKSDVYYGPDNKPMDLTDETKISPNPANVLGGTVSPSSPIPVKFTEVRKAKDGNDFTFQYPEIRKDGKLMTHLLNYGHVLEQNLYHALFEDGTTKHVSLNELKASGINASALTK